MDHVVCWCVASVSGVEVETDKSWINRIHVHMHRHVSNIDKPLSRERIHLDTIYSTSMKKNT